MIEVRFLEDRIRPDEDELTSPTYKGIKRIARLGSSSSMPIPQPTPK